MRQSNFSHINGDEAILVLKGGIFELAPLTLPLSVLVIVQNIVIFMDYYKDRAKLVPSLFMGIALADVLKAQGELVLSVISIFVYTGYLDISVLLNSIFYFTTTSLPGINCSKVFNLVMSISLTRNLINPFSRPNAERIRKIAGLLCLAIVLLHICDAITGIVIHLKYLNAGKYSQYKVVGYLYFLASGVPGALTIGMLVCMPDKSGGSLCIVNSRDKNPLTHKELAAIVITVGGLHYLIPILVVLICMVIQIRYLRKSLKDRETESPQPGTTRHVSITIFMTSTLFFICNIAFFTIMVTWIALHHNIIDSQHLENRFFVHWGEWMGLAKFILPMVYSLIYPIIIISRKEELRVRYMGYIRRFATCITRDNRTRDNTDT